MPSLTRLRELHVELCRRSMAQVREDWEMQIGLQLQQCEADGSFVHALEEWRPAWNAQNTLLLSTRIEGGCQGPFHLLFPEELGWELVKAVSPPSESEAGEPGETGETGQPGARGAQALSAEQVEVFKEMANLLCGSYNSLFGQLNRELRLSQAVDDLSVHALPAGSRFEGELEHIDRGLATSCTLTQGEESYEVVQLMPIPLARAIAQHLTLDPQGTR